MTTITPFAAGSYLTNRTASQLSTLKNQLNDLSNQISSGLVSQTYGGLGSGRSTALGAQATLSALTGYASGITAGQTRTNLAVTSLTQVVTLATSASATLNNGLQSVAASSVAGRSTALGNLQSAFDALNQSAAGNYLFGGSDTTTQPVADTDAILNGVTNSDGSQKAGLTQMIAEQVGADQGPGKNGWLSVAQSSTPPTQVSITEPSDDNVRANFGFSLAGKPTSTTSAIQATYTAGTSTSAGSLQLNVAAQPAVGDSITVTLKMHDGTSTTMTLTAVAAGTTPANSATTFALGANGDTTATAANLSAALTGAVGAAATGPLTATSAATAASHFFTGSVKGGPNGTGVMPQRVLFDTSTGTPGTPIGYRSATPQDTVLWYQGENTYTSGGTQTPALDTQSVQVSATSSIGTGARAIDPAVQNVLAGLATMAFGLPTSSSTSPNATYQAVIDAAGPLLASANGSTGVQDTVTQLSLASARLTNASTTNKAIQNTAQNTLDGIEQAPTEEVVAKLLDVQNRLQASYQVTATLSKLSLVNYIS
ncbi:flagellin [Methylobacterium mesophilicum SR1.6/6]|uniref:Flagellin n=1 Tax=Methylobacterium mesophilicum SR1.6/6 TaxID=908290 RepID=A0A6B9FBL6_9HYPH|nr:flagellin [Methylobacterium mesophilicum]QGY00991.1 flagellin [Methylobacterium mesophilicum SR1.6/6]